MWNRTNNTHREYPGVLVNRTRKRETTGMNLLKRKHLTASYQSEISTYLHPKGSKTHQSREPHKDESPEHL